MSNVARGRVPDLGGGAARRRAVGFTLIELLTVIAVTAILAASAVPMFERIIADARVVEAGNTFRSALELARSDATVRAVRVGVCRSANANGPAPSCSGAAEGTFGAGDWAAGWMIYAKADVNAGDDFEAGDVLIRRQGPLGTVNAGARVMLWAPGPGTIVFNWNGVRTAGPVGAFAIDHGMPVTTRPGVLQSERASCLAVNAAGRLGSSKPVSGACE
ncbi:MAG: GspH/FimT family pseudopilin [Burkholderiales bacterium]